MATVIDTGQTIDELMQQAAELLVPPTRDEDELTTRMAMRYTGLDRHAVFKGLNNLVEKGLLTKRKILVDGIRMNGYKPVGEGGWTAIISYLQE